MANVLMYSQMAMGAASQLGQYATASIQASVDSRIKTYQDTMTKLSVARSLNSTTVNEVRSLDAMTVTDVMAQRQSMEDVASAEVAAAAAGVKGNSIEAVATDLRASAGRASYARTRQFNQAMSEFGNQRTTTAIAAVRGSSNQVVSKPSIGSTLLGMGTSLLDVYDSHQPTGSKLLGPNGGRVNDAEIL